MLAVPSLRVVPIAPWERFAFVGKTGSGKTTTGTCLACKLVHWDKKKARGWEIWWLDSKGDQRDLERLQRWGFTFDRGPRRVFLLRDEGKGPSLHEQMEIICAQALRRHGVLIVVDEYVHVVKNREFAGRELLNVFQRGRGLDVGILGFTQEPVFIPRQLLSQAAHVFLHDLSYPRDKEYARQFLPEYDRPPRSEPHGFWHGAIDYDGNWRYWANAQEWLSSFDVTS